MGVTLSATDDDRTVNCESDEMMKMRRNAREERRKGREGGFYMRIRGESLR